MNMTYRTRRRLRRLWITLGCLVSIFLVVWVCWLFWLERFVVYSADGAELRLGEDHRFEGGVVAEPPQEVTVSIHYNEGSDRVNTSSELGQLSGSYATTSMLLSGVDAVNNAITQLPGSSAVMLDLKSIYGNFYYNTSISGAPVADQIDSAAIDRLIRNLAASDHYLIARVPAFRDRAFGLENTSYGLPTSRGYLWSDDESCYWLDPTSNGALNYLISIANELRELGFDEVVFYEFRYPDTDQIITNSSLTRSEAIAQAASILVTSCATEQFAVSFQSDDENFPLPEGRSRLYLTDVPAAKAQAVYNESTVPVKESQLVFLTETNDTRYDIASVMRVLAVTEVTG